MVEVVNLGLGNWNMDLLSEVDLPGGISGVDWSNS